MHISIYFSILCVIVKNDFGTSGTILGLFSTINDDVLNILGQVAQF